MAGLVTAILTQGAFAQESLRKAVDSNNWKKVKKIVDSGEMEEIYCGKMSAKNASNIYAKVFKQMPDESFAACPSQFAYGFGTKVCGMANAANACTGVLKYLFADAEKAKAILFLDEADSMIRDRNGAARSWEVTQVNEMLTQMENFKGIFIAATNFEGELDVASRRRFALKVKFGYLKPEGIEKMWKAFFPKVEFPEAALNLRMLAPGDFNAAYGSLRFYNDDEITASTILEALKSELAYKDSRQGRTMGF